MKRPVLGVLYVLDKTRLGSIYFIVRKIEDGAITVDTIPVEAEEYKDRVTRNVVVQSVNGAKVVKDPKTITKLALKGLY